MIKEFRIEILKGNDAGAQFRVTGERVVFGRATNCDIVITDSSVSRNHAELIKIESGYLLKDLNSSNGIFVNSRKVLEYTLEAGDVFTIGDHAYKFSIIEKKELNTQVPKIKKGSVAGLSSNDSSPHVSIPNISSGSNKRRIILYGTVGLVLILLLVIMLQEDEKPKKDTSKEAKTDTFVVDEADVIFNRKIEPGMEELYNRANEYYFAGRREFRLKNYVRALEDFRRATTFYPKHGQAKYYVKITDNFIDKESKKLLELGKRLMSQFKYDNAIKCFRDVMDFNVQKPDSAIFKEAEKYKAVAEKRKAQINK